MKGLVTISRVTDQDCNHEMRIRIEDEASGIEFVSVTLSMEEFALAITGYAFQPAEMEVRDLQYVGKRRITERREIVCPLATHDREKLSKWLEENAQDPGWLISTYLGSQTSVATRYGKTILRYHAVKYV